MPMNAPVMETTGTDLVPTSYICGRTFLMSFSLVMAGPRLRKVRPTNTQKSPKAAKMLVVERPTCSMKETGMGGNDSGMGAGEWGWEEGGRGGGEDGRCGGFVWLKKVWGWVGKMAIWRRW